MSHNLALFSVCRRLVHCSRSSAPMNILRLVADEKRRQTMPNPQFEKLRQEASGAAGESPLKYSKAELRDRLSPLQFQVTQQSSTERAFSGKYLHLKEEGVYTCVVCDTALFRSDQKYESMCGWPSFQDVISHGKVTVKRDTSHGAQRIEISCSQCSSHLGHVFDDGPKPTRVRYCVNSASLDFKKHTTV